ncbi:hypothetical protein CsatB_019326 [Cannabis sativa]
MAHLAALSHLQNKHHTTQKNQRRLNPKTSRKIKEKNTIDLISEFPLKSRVHLRQASLKDA